MVARAEEALGGLDVLVNNAGLGLHAAIAELDPDDLRYVFEVNVMAPHVATVAALPGTIRPRKPFGAPAADVGRTICKAITHGSAELFIPAYYQPTVGVNSIAPQVLRVAGKPGMAAATRLAEKFL